MRAHGLNVEWRPAGESLVVAASYDDGSPAANADAEVSGPGGGLHTTGSTDAAGLFAFVPAGAGSWTVVVDDGFGHRQELVITHEPGAAAATPGAMSPGTSWRELGTGLAIIFGVTGFWLWRRKAEEAAR